MEREREREKKEKKDEKNGYYNKMKTWKLWSSLWTEKLLLFCFCFEFLLCRCFDICYVRIFYSSALELCMHLCIQKCDGRKKKVAFTSVSTTVKLRNGRMFKLKCDGTVATAVCVFVVIAAILLLSLQQFFLTCS